ncbi:hypothetical protein HDU96_004122, partial [Phlyctochytrium bullatum]
MSADWTLLFPAITGLFITLQGGASGLLATHLGRGPATVWTIETSSLAALLAWLIATHGAQHLDFASARAEAPWWAYLGGPLGAFYVVSMTSLIRRLGGAVFFLVTVVVQLATSTVMDHEGWFELKRVPATAGRVGGVVVAGVGVALVTVGAAWAERRGWGGWWGVTRQVQRVDEEVAVSTTGLVAVVEEPRATKKAGPDVNASTPKTDEMVVVVATAPSTLIEDSKRPVPTPLPAAPPATPSPAPDATPKSPAAGLLDPAIVFPALSGMFLSFQSGMNGRLGRTAYGGFFATVVSLLTANVCMVTFMVVDAWAQRGTLRGMIDFGKFK